MCYIERSVIRQNVNIDKIWSFELGNSGELTPITVVVGFKLEIELIHKHIVMQLLLNFRLLMRFVT